MLHECIVFLLRLADLDEKLRIVQERVNVIEVFENEAITKVLKELEAQGMDVKKFTAGEEPRYHLIDGSTAEEAPAAEGECLVGTGFEVLAARDVGGYDIAMPVVGGIDPDPVLGVLTAIAGAAFVWGAFRGSLS